MEQTEDAYKDKHLCSGKLVEWLRRRGISTYDSINESRHEYYEKGSEEDLAHEDCCGSSNSEEGEDNDS